MTEVRHPSPDELRRFRSQERGMSTSARQRVADHLASCATCRLEVAAAEAWNQAEVDARIDAARRKEGPKLDEALGESAKSIGPDRRSCLALIVLLLLCTIAVLWLTRA
jgi:hypothetical protein